MLYDPECPVDPDHQFEPVDTDDPNDSYFYCPIDNISLDPIYEEE